MVLLICYLVLILAYIICGLGAIRMCRDVVLNRSTGKQLDDSNLDRFIVIAVWPFVVFIVGLFYSIDKCKQP